MSLKDEGNTSAAFPVTVSHPASEEESELAACKKENEKLKQLLAEAAGNGLIIVHKNSMIDDHMTCHYCRLRHKDVEAGGVHHCPNVLCKGPGAFYFRTKLKSYKAGTDSHTVDGVEMVQFSIDFIHNNKDLHPLLKQKIIESIPLWV